LGNFFAFAQIGMPLAAPGGVRVEYWIETVRLAVSISFMWRPIELDWLVVFVLG
jgi:hypothetical protein